MLDKVTETYLVKVKIAFVSLVLVVTGVKQGFARYSPNIVFQRGPENETGSFPLQ